MLTVRVDLLHETSRASGSDIALTGGIDPGEWPLSPARLFAAFVAADGTRERSRLTDGSELLFLENQPPPVIVADGPKDVLVSPVVERYVVVNERRNAGTVQEYTARTSSVARPGTRSAPRHPTILYIWPDAEPTSETLDALRLRAARIGYLGSSDSPVRVTVERRLPDGEVDRWSPDDGGESPVSVPFPGLTEVLDVAFDEFASGVTVRRAWYRSERVMYRAPGLSKPVHTAGGTTIWLRFDVALPGRKVLAVTETLRRAVLDLYEGSIPDVVTGHGFDGRGYQHTHWLALADVGHPMSRGRIHGAAILLPDGCPDDVVTAVRAATRELARRELVKPGVFSANLRPYGGEQRPWAAHPSRWVRPAYRFASVFPVVHERYVRPEPSLSDVAEWCEHAGLPTPIEARLMRDPALPGAVSLHPHHVFRSQDERRPYSHMLLVFDRPVRGPVVLGRKRQFGLGLFAPLPEEGNGDG